MYMETRKVHMQDCHVWMSDYPVRRNPSALLTPKLQPVACALRLRSGVAAVQDFMPEHNAAIHHRADRAGRDVRNKIKHPVYLKKQNPTTQF